MAKPAKKPAPKVKPVGTHLNWTEADLDRLSDVTPEDQAAAKAFWRRQAPKPLRKLLDAKPRKRK